MLKTVSAEANRMSAAAIMSMAPPMQAPCTAHTTGCGARSMALKASCIWVFCCW